MLIINCEINLILTRSMICKISAATSAIPFKIIEKKAFHSISSLTTQGNVNLLKQLKLGLTNYLTGININQKCQLKTSIQIILLIQASKK